MEPRITELEVRYSYHERQIEELSRVLYEQGRTIERLLARLERTEQRLGELLEAMTTSPAPERPPHY